MSTTTRKHFARRQSRNALLFAALGDEVRLGLLARLSGGTRLSISQLAAGSAITRQAITKHLRVLEGTGLVRGVRQGREHLFQLEPKSLKQACDSLNWISRQWDEALARLKSYVED
jgi:DNA-binding transcriptional ArsR family regulator